MLPLSIPAALLVLARVAGLAWTAPGWSSPALGVRLRLGLVVALVAIILPLVGPTLTAPVNPGTLALACAVELAVGVGLGLAMGLVIASARLAGEIIGLQAGLSTASLLDPESADTGELTPMGSLYGLVALGAFLALDGPLQLVDSLLASYRTMPAGASSLDHATVALLFSRMGDALGLALRAAAPVALSLVFAGLALGWLGRAAGSLQGLSLGLPARWALGLVLAILGLSVAASVFAQAWTAVLSAAPR